MTKTSQPLPNLDLYLYILVRSDLPSMGYGKGMAQGAHAANQFTDEHIIRPLMDGKGEVDADVLDWRQHADGFGTTITLDVPNLTDMESVVRAAQALGYKANTTVDPTYPYIVDREVFALLDPAVHADNPVALPDGTYLCFRRETTTAYVFGDKNVLSVLLRRFKLLNNDK